MRYQFFNSRFKTFIGENCENQRESRIPRISRRHEEFITCNWLFCGSFCILLSQLQKVPISAVFSNLLFYVRNNVSGWINTSKLATLL